MPWFRRLVAGISVWRSGFIPRPVRVSFVVDKMVQKTCLFPVLLFSPISVIPPIFRTHFHLHVALIRRTHHEDRKPSKKHCFLRKSWIIRYKCIVIFTMDSRDESAILREIEMFSYLQVYWRLSPVN